MIIINDKFICITPLTFLTFFLRKRIAKQKELELLTVQWQSDIKQKNQNFLITAAIY